jgi:putative ABC transport system ATP-binding protein
LTEAIIRLEAATKSFRQGRRSVPVLKGVDLTVEAGEFVSIMGPSGSGKTTVLSLLSCLDTLSSGTYCLDGRDITNLSVKRRARIRNRHFGYVFQNYNLLPRASAQENVELPLLYRGMGIGERRQRAVEMLDAFGLGDRMHHRPAELSGGEQQRVALARAVAASPDVLFADEPTGSLDSRTGTAIMEILERLHRSGLTIVLVTHDPHVARRANRIIQLFDGRVEGQSSNSELTRA